MSSGTGISPPSAKGLPRQNKNHSTFLWGGFCIERHRTDKGACRGGRAFCIKKQPPKGLKNGLTKRRKSCIMKFHTVAVCPDEDSPSSVVILPQEGANVKRKVNQN